MGEGYKVILTMYLPFTLVIMTALVIGIKKENEQEKIVQAIKRAERSEREVA